MINMFANILTGLCLFCGFLSILFSLESQFTFAVWAIFGAVIFDGLDGQVARRNPVPSDFGKEFDSLCDAVSFGVAPTILGYIFIYREFYLWGAVGSLFIYLLASVTRLARYNIAVKDGPQFCFTGLPTTVSGGVLASFILIYRWKGDVVMPPYVPVMFFALVFVLAYLMVSRVRYLNLDGVKKMFGKTLPVVITLFFILCVAAGVFRKAGIASFCVFLIYLIFSPFVVKRLNS